MYPMKKTIVFSVALIAVSTMYLGYRIHRTHHALEQYKQNYGYRTPTTGLAACVFEDSAWKALLIDSAIGYTDGAHNIEPYDIDGDGSLELIANAYRSDALMTYQYSPAGCARSGGGWVREVIDPRVGGGFPRRPAGAYTKALLKRTILGGYTEGAHYTAIGDVNGDGRADLVVAGDLTRYDVVWYEAMPPGQKGPAWKKHVAYQNDSHRTYHVEIGDIDGDGDNDIVFATKTDDGLGWLENRGTPGPWPAVVVDSNCTRCFYARVVDLVGEGHTEIIASRDDWRDGGGKMHLYTHSGDPRVADNWQRHDIASCPPGRGLSVFITRDIDADGDLDVVAGNHQGDVLVLRNPSPDPVRGPWDTWCVNQGSAAGNGRDFREIDVGDIDLDGDPDVVVADEKQDAIVWFENPGETFCGGWREHVVDQSHVYLRWCHSVKLGDMDGDGDLDIAVAAAGSNVFLLYLNQMTSKSSLQIAAAVPGY